MTSVRMSCLFLGARTSQVVGVSAMLAVIASASPVLAQSPLGSAFPYRGYIEDAGAPASGTYDFEVRLFDAATAGAPVGTPAPLVHEDVSVVAGRFDLRLDFGVGAFGSAARWIDVAVRPGTSTGAFTPLGPRQPVTPTPVTMHAATTDTLGPGACAVGQVLRWSGGAWGCSAEFPSGSVTAIATAQGLTGGTITDQGTIGVGSRGISRPKLADGAVTAAALAPQAVGPTQIDFTTVQARITGACPVGQYLAGVGAAGQPSCLPLAGGLVRSNITIAAPRALAQAVVGQDGRPFIAWRDDMGRVLVTSCGDAACAAGNVTRTIDAATGASNLALAVALSATRLPVVAYVNASNQVTIARCRDRSCRDVTSIRAPGRTIGPFSDLALAVPGERPYVVYADSDGLHQMLCHSSECATAGIADLRPSSELGARILFAFGPDGRFIVGRDSTVYHCGAGCSGATTAAVVPNTSVLQSIAFDPTGLPIFSFLDGNGSPGLLFCGNASCSSGNRTMALPRILPGTSRDTRVVVDASGFPSVFHLDTDTGAGFSTLRWTRCRDAACNSASVQDVENRAALDGFSAIAPADGLPVVVSAGNPIRVLKCLDGGCQ